MSPDANKREDRSLTACAWDALTDANPVLAKELFVTLRTPVYVRGIVVAALLLTAVVVWSWLSRSPFDSHAGRRLFDIYFVGLALLLGTVGAALGSTVIVQEREGGALEALKLSSLSPHRIVFGKFAAIVLAEGAIAVGTLPLLVIVLGMGGVSLDETVTAMTIALTCGILTTSVGIAVSAHTTHMRRALLVSLLASGMVGIGVTTWLVARSMLLHSSSMFGSTPDYFDATRNGGYVALLLVFPAYAVTTILGLAHASATSGLLDPSRDRSLPIKHWTVWALGASMVAIATYASQEYSAQVAIAGMIVTATIALALLFVFAGEPVTPTRWMRAHPPSLLSRILFPRCLAPSVLFTVVASGGVLLSLPLLSVNAHGFQSYALWTVAYLATLGGFMGRVAARRGSARARVLGLAATSVLLLAGLFHDPVQTTWVDALCPLWLTVGHARITAPILPYSVLAWSLAALVSLALMLRAVQARSRRASG
jgi:ABC-type transport system involved in cytochrome c biogenesis permease component